MKKILIATNNQGKFKELVAEFSDLHLKFVNLKDLKLDKIKVEEPFSTLAENALHKAKTFAKLSKLTTIAEDTGLFVDYLKGAPGVKTKRFGKDAKDRQKKILNALKNIPTKNRQAAFITNACLYDPDNDSYTVFVGKVKGQIATQPIGVEQPGMDFDPIFYFPKFKKTFAEISIARKNLVSHRGQIATQLKRFLTKQYNFKQYLVVGGIVVKDRKALFTKRRDPRSEFNNKWEFPGGGIDNKEAVITALKRELKEETGFNVEPIEQLPEIVTRVEEKYGYQVFLLLFICKIKSGELKTSDTEVADHGWFTIKEALKLDWLPANQEVISNNYKTLKKYID